MISLHPRPPITPERQGGMLDTLDFTDKVARLFRARRMCRVGRRLAAMKDFYETPVSAIENSPQTSARLSQPQLDEERPGHFEQSPSRWPQTAYAGRDIIIMVAPAHSLGLPRERRITRGRDFIRARAKGRRLAVGCLLLNWVNASDGRIRIGVITSRKIGNAVIRARARRLLREAFRQNQHRVARNVDLVLVARASIVGKQFAGVEMDFVTALRQAGLLVQE
jgi:ribonuclease P protein component